MTHNQQMLKLYREQRAREEKHSYFISSREEFSLLQLFLFISFPPNHSNSEFCGFFAITPYIGPHLSQLWSKSFITLSPLEVEFRSGRVDILQKTGSKLSELLAFLLTAKQHNVAVLFTCSDSSGCIVLNHRTQENTEA